MNQNVAAAAYTNRGGRSMGVYLQYFTSKSLGLITGRFIRRGRLIEVRLYCEILFVLTCRIVLTDL